LKNMHILVRNQKSDKQKKCNSKTLHQFPFLKKMARI
jgi:hypothetical protein